MVDKTINGIPIHFQNLPVRVRYAQNVGFLSFFYLFTTVNQPLGHIYNTNR
jgi:hypothetical protein